jgi:hypothetical protein
MVQFPAESARSAVRQRTRFRGSSLPIPPSSAISPAFIARLIKGCRGDGSSAGQFIRKKPEHFQRSNEHFSRPAALAGGFVLWQLGEPNAQAEDQVGR